MKNEIMLSHWGQELDRKISREEESIINTKKKLDDSKYVKGQIEIQIQSGIRSLESLTRQKTLYAPSPIIGQIDALQDEINSQSSEFEKLIALANAKVERIGQQISAAQIKADIAKQFNGSADSDQELANLTEEMAKVNNELTELRRRYQVFTVAKNHQNDACLVSKDTPGYRMRSLRGQLTEETNTFKDDMESKVNALYEEIDTAVNTIMKAAQTIGELSLTVKLRDSELQASGFAETGLQNKLKAIQLKSDLKHRTLQQIVDARRFVD